MALASPRTDVLAVGFSDQTFRLQERQEFSRTGNGRTYGKSFGSALWTATWQTGPMLNTDLLDYEAVLNSLDGVIGTFYAYDLRRPYPRAYPTGAFTDSGQINSLGTNGKSLSLKLLAAGFVLSRGDYLAFDYGAGPSRALHQVMETVTANGSGLTSEFEVRPYIRPGATVSTPVVLKKPPALFCLQPDSIQQSIVDGMHGSISFSAMQVI
ncbi:hypothetical protein [Mesorhizobium sp. BE184]|uniref:hypothetical protein n=1 Tax=Mesorhizobium sp. BE184 TaxID=2817714 RepID=UPI002857AB73|nr:hypothetical protein [Mesorhizobium sp. BE184]MDR7032930.1 hypothetical protein [Mesorhizobium sp. BE184]